MHVDAAVSSTRPTALNRELASAESGVLPKRRFEGASSGIWTFTQRHICRFALHQELIQFMPGAR